MQASILCIFITATAAADIAVDLCAVNPPVCEEATQCREAGICNPETGECEYQNIPDDFSCDDGDDVTVYDHCEYGECIGIDMCGGLAQCGCFECDPSNGACYDGLDLELRSLCGNATECRAAPVCITRDRFTCVAGEAYPDGTECDDGDDSTAYDQCTDGVCAGTDVCQDTLRCGCLVCDPPTGACLDEPVADGTPCSDGNPDTNPDTCQNGECVGTPPPTVAPSTQCESRHSVSVNGVLLPAEQLLGATEFEATQDFPLSVHKMHPALAYGTMYQVSSELREGDVIVMECCDGPCDLYVAVYRCKGCPASELDGGIPGPLLAKQWIASSACAPSFSKPSVGSEEHPMVVLHKQVPSGVRIQMPPLTKDAAAVIFWASYGYTGEWCPEVITPWRPRGPYTHTCTLACFDDVPTPL